MYALNERKKRILSAGKGCAYLAVFVALTIAAQLCLSAIPGVEVVTVLFVSFAFSFGVWQGVLAATAFSLLRQFIFGFLPNVLILYLVYYNLLAMLFGFLGRKMKNPLRKLWLLVLLACFCTVCFTLLDDIITPLWYSYTSKAARAYFYASFTIMIPQVICTAVTVGLLFLPLRKVFVLVKR